MRIVTRKNLSKEGYISVKALFKKCKRKLTHIGSNEK